MGESRIAPTLQTDFVTIKKIRLCNLLEKVDLHTPKPPKWHIKHELNAHLSTPTIADSFSSGILQVYFLCLFSSHCLSLTLQRYIKDFEIQNNRFIFNIP
jgi:hypothetical protein